MKKNRTFAVFNFLVLSITVYWNYYFGTSGINGKTVASVSEQYDNLFTPASYAFSIWGLIYLALFCHCIYQLVCAFSKNKKTEFIAQIDLWLIIANLANMSWLWAWLKDYTGLSVLIMIVLLSSLLVIIFRLNMERWDAPLPIIAWTWWPIDLYAGWIIVALIANVSAWLTKIGWLWGLSESGWAITMIIAAVIINLLAIWKRNLREVAAVAIWALVAIAVRHWTDYSILKWTALIGSAILLIAISIHAYKNRQTNPMYRLLYRN